MGSFIIAIVATSLTAVSTISVFVGMLLKSKERQVKTEDKLAQLQKDFEEQTISNKEKFKDYYDFKYVMTQQIADIRSDTKNIMTILSEMKEDLKK